LGIYEVFEVLYSPVKAFEKIVAKPDFKAVLLILVLFISFTAVGQCVVYSKIFLLTETPDDDDWTESTALWTSNGSLSLDDADFKAGNYSVKSSVSNDTNIWMKITDIGPFDCSEEGYKELFFWIKWTHENGVPSSNATLRLFSDSESGYFELNLAGLISNSSDEWSNATLKIGPENQGWTAINSPDWKSVTGLEFRLAWLTPANLTLKIDDLHFRKYVSFFEKSALGVGAVIQILMPAAVAFSVNWILWALILFMITKVFREEGGPWTMFFIIIGHVFIVTVVYTAVSVALISTLSPLNLPLRMLPPTTEAEANAVNASVEERWVPNWAYWGYLLLSGLYLPFVRELWIVALCVTAIRPLLKITWGKATSISMVSFIMRSVLTFLFGI
jgi:hypothetical protein